MGAPLAAVPAARRSRQREPILLGACILLLLLATVPPLINLGRYQRRLASAISRSLGRPVAMDGVSLRLIPWPALEISNLSVSEEPEFGAEPALLAPEVVAELRLSSLWRGRFELSHVELTDASVNLVRAPSGRWNVSSVLLQASQVQSAPTSQSHPGPELRFPFIQATGTRINFKRGDEKLPYSLLNADFSMVLARPNVWQLQLEGQPDRTDLQLSPGDTGSLRLAGELHRSADSTLGSMPLALHGEWKHAPLGELSELLFGADAGWRGEVDATATFGGEVDRLRLSTKLLFTNVHRQEFTPEQPLTLDLTCQATYLRAAGSIHTGSCLLPLGAGRVLLRQDDVPPEKPTQEGAADSSRWELAAEHVPVSAVASLFSVLGPAVPAPANFTGEINGAMSYRRETHELAGSFTSEELTIAHAALGGLPLQVTGLRLQPDPSPIGSRTLLLSADPVPLGLAGRPVLLSGEFTRSSYTVHAAGAASLPALAAAASGLHLHGLSALTPVADAPLPTSEQATAMLALTSAGRWGLHETPEPPAAHVSGQLEFAHVRWKAPWLPVPVQLPSLHAALSPGLVRWSTAAATLGTGDRQTTAFAGDAEVPLGCETGYPCIAHVHVRCAALNAAELQSVLGGGQEPLLSSLMDQIDRLHGSQGSFPALEGSLQAAVLTLGRLPIHNATLRAATASSPDGNSIQLQTLDGQALGGSLHLHGLVSFPGGKPTYTLKASLTGASAAQAAALWQEHWGPGTVEVDADLRLAGRMMTELQSGASGSFRLVWLQGSLAPALPPFESLDASGTVGQQGLHIEHGALVGTSAGTPMSLEGTLGWDRSLALQLAGAGEGRAAMLSGTPAAPILTPEPALQR